MPETYIKLNGKVDRRGQRNEGDFTDVYQRENLLARDGVLTKPMGTERAIDTTLTTNPRWLARYHSIETGVISPKSYCYTKDGVLWRINDQANSASKILETLNPDGYPRSWMFKSGSSTFMYMVDGKNLYKYDGNNDDLWTQVSLVDSDGNSVEPLDVIEHKDRSFVISERFLFVSKNLDFDTFDDATDSIQLAVGSGKGKNLALGKIEDNLYIFNTEGIYVVAGDVISAVASTFEVRQVDERKIIATRSLAKVEKALMFLADDRNVWSWDGANSTKMSHSEKLEDFVNEYREHLDKAVATYEDNYYKLSFVEKGQTDNKLEWWWDAFENKGTFVRGRNVSDYMQSDPTVERLFTQICSSTAHYILNSDVNHDFDNSAIRMKLWTKDIPILKNHNVRILGFMPDLGTVGDINVTIHYILDGRLGTQGGANWSQNLQGEDVQVGAIKLSTQSSVTDNINPKIRHSRGETIALLIDDSTKDTEFKLKGLGIEYVDKGLTKGRKVGQ